MAVRRAKQEMLRQTVAATDLIAANKIGVLGLQIRRADDTAFQDFSAHSRRTTLQNIQRARGKGLYHLRPFSGGDLPRGIAPDHHIRAAFAKHHPEGLARNPFQIGKQPAAADVGREIAAVRNQLCRTPLERCLADEKWQVHRRPVVAKPRQRVVACLHRPIGRRGLFEHPHAPILCRQRQGTGQRIVATPIRTASKDSAISPPW